MKFLSVSCLCFVIDYIYLILANFQSLILLAEMKIMYLLKMTYRFAQQQIII